MVKKPGNYKIPYDSNGNMLQDGGWYGRRGDVIWLDNEPIEDEFAFDRKMAYQSYVLVVNSEGRHFPIFISDFLTVAANSVIDHGRIARRKWVGIKKGTHYGIVPLEE